MDQLGRGDSPGPGHRRPEPGAALGTTLRERLGAVARPGWAQGAAVRRVVAALLVVLAAALAVRGQPGAALAPVVVATHDLQSGQVIGAADIVLRRMGTDDVPGGAMTDAADLQGRSVAGAVRAGEPLTDVRVVGPALVASVTSTPDAVAVPVRLADVAVAELLRPGDRVAVVRGSDAASTARPVEDSALAPPRVLADGATVLLVGAPEQRSAAKQGRLVVLALPPDQASAVASASLAEPLTVTVR